MYSNRVTTFFIMLEIQSCQQSRLDFLDRTHPSRRIVCARPHVDMCLCSLHMANFNESASANLVRIAYALNPSLNVHANVS